MVLMLIVILLLFFVNIFIGYKYFVLQKKIENTKIILKTQQTNKKILEFTKFFIEKVLKAKTEINFETRLKLESLVQDLNNKEILIQWQKFLESKTETEAQNNTNDLLKILIEKINL